MFTKIAAKSPVDVASVLAEKASRTHEAGLAALAAAAQHLQGARGVLREASKTQKARAESALAEAGRLSELSDQLSIGHTVESVRNIFATSK